MYVLHLEGGGWCWSPEDCALRADSKLGSSSTWPKGRGNVTIGGLVNRCCDEQLTGAGLRPICAIYLLPISSRGRKL